MEKLDIYTADHRRTGRIIERDGGVAAGEFLLVVHICLFNRRGELLIQKRQSTKDRYGGCWDMSAGGFARSGESGLEAVLREAAEEIGLVLEREEVSFLFTEPFSYVLDDFFLARCDAPAESFRIQSDEVAAVKWADREEVMQMLDEGRFVDYDPGLLERCFVAGEEKACDGQENLIQ